MTLHRRLERLEKRQEKRPDAEPLEIIVRRRLFPDGVLVSERRLRFLHTPGGLVRVEEPNRGPEGQI
jgi:hypothetical protein